MFQIDLPWPDAALSPNARVSRWEHARVKKAAKNYAWGWTKAAMGPLGIKAGTFVGPIKVTYTFHPVMVRDRDDDNFAARMKAARDGIAMALGVDDKEFRMQPVVFGDLRNPPCVTVTIEPAMVRIESRGTIS